MADAETRGVSPRALAAALPDFALAAWFLSAWLWPERQRAGTVQHLVLVMLLEFIIVHSSAFMGKMMISPSSRRAKAVALLGLGAFYTLFVGAFSLAFKSAWPLVSFWGLTLNRLMSVLVGQAPEGEEALFLQRGWAVCAVAYLGFTVLTIVLPVPRLGLTPDAVAALDLEGSGLWIEQPWRVLAFGSLYFAGVGLSELTDHRWLGGAGRRPTVADAGERRAA